MSPLSASGSHSVPVNGSAPDAIKVYVGTQIEQMIAVKVLDYSIRKYTQQPVEVMPLFAAVEQASIEIPTPKDRQLRPRTPFSFQRFAIPQLNGYQGRAIYVDSDMQVFRDIAELWSWPFEGADLLSVCEPPDSGRPPQFSVMVLNCDQLRWDAPALVRQLEDGKWTYKQFMAEMAPADTIAAVLPSGWNDLERYTPGETALVHYTDMDTQPWLTVRNPLAQLWCADLLEAIQQGVLSRTDVQTEVEKGYIRPSLLYQIDHHISDPQQLPETVVQSDRHTFVPPHVLQKISVKRQGSQAASAPSLPVKLLHKLYARGRALLNRYP
ncbi:MAG: glycosyltransferase [Cyanobacteria bacterium P01_D01_bin.14]